MSDFYEIKAGNVRVKDLPYIVNRANSYLGLMMHCNSFNIRKKILTSKEIEALGKYAYTNKKLSKLSIYDEFNVYKIGKSKTKRVKQFFPICSLYS